MKRIAWLVCIVALLTACSPEWGMPVLVIQPGEYASDAPPEPSYALPDGPPAASGFGLAWNPVERLEPLEEKTTLNTALLGLMYEGLFDVDGTFAVRPRLCVSAETADNQEYILRLADAMFSDGSPLTAEDVAYSFTLARAAASPYAARLQSVASATAQQDGTVLVRLTGPRVRFTALLDFPIVRKGADAGLPAPPGTGPYMLRYDDEGSAVLTPNEYRRGHETLLPYRIDLLDASDPVNLGFYFQYRHISAVGYDFNDLSMPGLHSGFERYDYSTGVMQYIAVSAVSGPLLEPVVRKAISTALDRETMCREMFGGAEAACLPVPPGSAMYDKALAEPYGFDPVAALRLLSDAGCADKDADGVLEWPSGRKTLPLSFTMLVNAESPGRAEAAKRLAADLVSAGIELEIIVLPWHEYSDAVKQGLYDLYWAQAALTPDFDPGFFLSPGGALNHAQAATEGAAAALEALRAAPPESTPDAWRSVSELWLEKAPFITVGFNKRSLVTQRGLFRTPTPTAGNLYYGFSGWGLVGDEHG